MSDFNDQINKLVHDFVAQVSALARKAAMDTLTSALAGGGGGAVAAPRRGRPPGVASAAPAASSARRAKGAKRAPDEIVRTRDRLYQYITSNPGQRIEQINKALGTSTKDLTLPIKKLLGSKAITSKGEKRATTYFPGDGKPDGDGGGKKKRRKG